jgi:hypothetical protein
MRIVDIDRIAAAFDQRSVPIVLGRTFFIFGSLFAAASAWPPSNMKWTGIGIFLAGAGLLVGWAFRNPGNRVIRIATGIGAVLLGAALTLDAILGVTPAGQITPFSTMDAAFTDALAIANARYGALPWLLARSIASLFEAGIGLEFIVAGYLICRVRAADAHLLTERSGSVLARILSFLLDFPPGLLRFPGFSFLPAAAAFVAILFFAISMTNLAGARMIQNFGALSAVGACLDSGLPMDGCIDAAGRTAAAGMVGLALFSIGIFPWIGSFLMNWSRWKGAIAAANRLSTDSRAPILFLRSFRDDQVSLRPLKSALFRLPFSGVPSMQALDHILIERFLTVAPVVALGRSQEKAKGFPPFGAVRTYVDGDGDDAWRHEVQRLARMARKVVLVFDEEALDTSRGINWEIRHIGQSPELIGKTVFIVRPDWRSRIANDRVETETETNHSLWRSVGALVGFTVPDTAKPLLSCSIGTDGTLTATTTKRFDATAVLLAMRLALEDL